MVESWVKLRLRVGEVHVVHSFQSRRDPACKVLHFSENCDTVVDGTQWNIVCLPVRKAAATEEASIAATIMQQDIL